MKEENGKRELSAIVKFDMAFYIPKFVWNWMLGKGFNSMFKKGMDDLRAKKWLNLNLFNAAFYIFF